MLDLVDAIRQAMFSMGKRGYDPVQVDRFLEKIKDGAAEWEKKYALLEQEVIRMRDRQTEKSPARRDPGGAPEQRRSSRQEPRPVRGRTSLEMQERKRAPTGEGSRDSLQVNRQEIKYQISMLEFKKLEGKLRACMLEDPHNGPTGGYLVRSLYLDSPYEQDRLAVLRGGEQRHKIRLRVYSPDAEQVKLELKAKEGNNQRKSSLVLSREEAEQIIRGDFRCLRKKPGPTAEHIYLLLQQGMYRPRVMLEYDRTAYYLPSRDIRVTFDYNARANRCNFDLFDRDICWTPLRPASVGVLEVKFNGFLFSYVQELLGTVDKLPVSNGKYIYACNL